MKIQLSDHFTYGKLIRFTVPSVVMMIFTSIYGVVDGLFVSNFAGKMPFAAINLIMPFLIVLGAVGFMIGSGGSALVAKTLGEGKPGKANELFSLMVSFSIGTGAVLAVLGIVFLPQVAMLLGAEGDMVGSCVLYGRIILVAMPMYMLQNEFQNFLITAERPKLGLGVIVAAGCTNIVLDALFVGVMDGGIVGAAAATAISQVIGGAVPLIYFLRPNGSTLRLVRFPFDGRALVKACTNGSSELFNNISASIVSMLYNFRLMKFAGEDGVAAYGVLMYVGFIFAAAFIGYSIGSAPIVGYNFGAKNHAEQRGVFRKSLVIIGITSLAMVTLGELLAVPLSRLFVGYDRELYDMTVRAFRIFSLTFALCGVNIFSSSFFTALNDGLVSAVLAILRTLVFQVISILIVPVFFELDGVWYATVAAEALSFALTLYCFVRFRRKYHYW